MAYKFRNVVVVVAVNTTVQSDRRPMRVHYAHVHVYHVDTYESTPYNYSTV